MKLNRALAGLAALVAAAPLQAGVHPPEVEKRLSFIVGDWTIEGAERTFRETCKWYAGRSFVVCNSVDRESGKPELSVSILGWSAASRNYTYHHYGQDGRSRSETCFANDRGGLICLGERRDGASLVQTRSDVSPVDGGAAFRSERSVDGGPWSEAVRFKYVLRNSRR